jgi:hypothetical protein
MNRRLITISTLALTAILICLAVTDWWVSLPRRTLGAFVGHLSHERYEEAALMLIAPSAIEVDSNGGVVLVDHAGKPTAVPEARLHDGASG